MTKTRTLPAALAVALAVGASPAAADEFVFAHGANPGNPRYDAALLFAELVEQYSDGALTVSVTPSAVLGDDAEMLTSVNAGIIEMTANSQGPLAQFIPEAGALGLPFLFDGLPAAWAVLDGPVGEELNELANAQGFEIVTWWDNGIRNVTHVSQAIETPADLEGMRIRTPQDRSTIDAFQALGAAPSPLAWSELPTALRNGVFDGQENPLTNIYSARLHEITPFISMTGHKYEGTPVIASLAWWEGLSDAERDAVSRAAHDAGWYQRGRSLIDGQNLEAVLAEEGATIVQVDRAPFVEATAGVYDAWRGELGDFVTRLQEAAATAAGE